MKTYVKEWNISGNLIFNALTSFSTANHFSVPESDCLIIFEIYGKIVLQLGMDVLALRMAHVDPMDAQ